jgi:uncharacterized protein
MPTEVRQERESVLGMLLQDARKMEDGRCGEEQSKTILSTSAFQTFTGRIVNPTRLNPDDICDEDIAHALSQICRFAGHTKKFYSVAQHSVYVSMYSKTPDALWGLLHDASEAYLVDVPTPVKSSYEMAGYRILEARAMRAIMWHYGLPEVEPASVKYADRLSLVSEARTLVTNCDVDAWCSSVGVPRVELFPVIAWSPEIAENAFMGCLKTLKEFHRASI